jgi:hypothetical protein
VVPDTSPNAPESSLVRPNVTTEAARSFAKRGQESEDEKRGCIFHKIANLNPKSEDWNEDASLKWTLFKGLESPANPLWHSLCTRQGSNLQPC